MCLQVRRARLYAACARPERTGRGRVSGLWLLDCKESSFELNARVLMQMRLVGLPVLLFEQGMCHGDEVCLFDYWLSVVVA